jgi:peptidoglycan DL-endopeptidase CwlO
MQVSGVAVAAAAAGGVLAYAGLRDVTPLQALRDITSGSAPPPVRSGGIRRETPSAGAWSPSMAGLGGRIVNAARNYLGTPYRWGGAQPGGFDCSGLVTWVLHHDLGLSLPSNSHTVTGQFLIWSGAATVPPGSIQPGDLICWAGHIAIYSGSGHMIEAPHAGARVRETKARTAGATIRRVKGQ